MTLEPEKVDLESPDIAEANRAALAELFPGVLADGVLDVARLSELLDVPPAQVPEGRERYGLQWAGKHEALRSLLTPSDGALAPISDSSVSFDDAQNVIINGDNLEVLKLLQNAYNDRVKLIYIDPPYNTGSNEFIYPDDYSEPIKAYLEFTGQVDGVGNRVSTQVDLTGRRHSRWLSMMYPRLMLARNLLAHDGAVCVSIDANEDFNLRALLDEVFGHENFVAQLVVIRAEGGGMAEQVVQGHDLLLIYARDRSQFAPLRRPKDFRGQIVQHNGTEYWIEEDWLRKEFGKYGTCHYEEILEFRGAGSLAEVNEKLSTGEYRLIPKKNGMHVVGRLRPTATDGAKFYSVVKHLSKDGKARLSELGLAEVFDFPKPVSLVKSLILGISFGQPGCQDIIMDFFAGSGTTADAVLQQNAEDGGRRRFVLVTLPEKLEAGSVAAKAGFKTIADITYARVRAAMASLPADTNGGLRVFALQQSGFRQARTPATGELFNMEESTLVSHEWDAVAAEVLLKEGVPLDVPWARCYLAGARAVVAGGVAVVLTSEIGDDVVAAALELRPKVLVFMEDGFAGVDAVKANAFTNAKNLGITMKTV